MKAHVLMCLVEQRALRGGQSRRHVGEVEVLGRSQNLRGLTSRKGGSG